jgi:C-terminal domain on Strawberry notch homologue
VVVISDTPVQSACSLVHAASQGCGGSLKLWSRRRRRFLNRLLSLPCARQNLLFNYFAATLGAEIRAAKAEGRYFEGMSELAGVPKLKQVRVAGLCVPQCSVTTLRQWPLDA